MKTRKKIAYLSAILFVITFASVNGVFAQATLEFDRLQESLRDLTITYSKGDMPGKEFKRLSDSITILLEAETKVVQSLNNELQSKMQRYQQEMSIEISELSMKAQQTTSATERQKASNNIQAAQLKHQRFGAKLNSATLAEKVVMLDSILAEYEK